MRPFATKKEIPSPGRPGLRPPRFKDVTGDGKAELIVAADTETGRSMLAVYTAVAGKVLPILHTSGLAHAPALTPCPTRCPSCTPDPEPARANH